MGDELLDTLDRNTPLGERALSKLRWRCRRGLLENDLFIERFFNRYAPQMNVGQARGMYILMDLFMKRKPLGADIESEEVTEVLSLLMA
jgi:antitoxin CptB